MTKKDYIAIAAAIKASTQDEPGDDGFTYIFTDDLIRNLGQAMKAENPNFDLGRFDKACR